MVVSNLQSYFEKIPGAMYSANLRELIRQESTCREGEPNSTLPTIVLDESSSRCLFDPNSLPNSRPRIIKSKIEKFVENIISCGVNLIVVIRGNDVDVKKWYFKEMNEYEKKRKFLEVFDQEKISEDSLKVLPHLSQFCAKTTFSSIRRKHYTVFTSVEYAHIEISKIATQQNYLAVIGQDSNYLIYEGIRFYISIHSMNAETLDCKIYDRNTLIEHLGLKSYQLPLFATLCGNDVVPLIHLRNLHNTVSLSHGNKFLGIADKVKHTSAFPYKHIREMTCIINHPQINEDLISQSLDMYLKFHQKRVLTSSWRAFADERKRMNEWDATLHRVLVLKEIRLSSLTGFFATDIKPTVTLLRPLRKKIYGILLYEDEFPIVNEYCLEELIKSGKKYPVPTIVFAEKTKCEHPGLIQLWNKNTLNVNIVKWDLFCSSLTNLSHSVLRIVPTRLLFPTVALYYLNIQVPMLFGQKIFSKKFELEAFLVVALLMGTNLDEALPEAWHCDDLNAHVIYLSYCYIDTCYTLGLLNQACGLIIPKQECCICNFFDGILLHYVYQKMRQGAKWYEFFDACISLKVTFCTLMEIILSESD